MPSVKFEVNIKIMKKLSIALSTLILAFGIISCDQPKTESTDATTDNTTEVAKADETIGNPADVKVDGGPFAMPGLKYGYADMEKAIDAKTMEVHYSKHFLGYANKLNEAIKGTANESKSIEEIMKGLDLKNAALRNNGGGYYNHSLYFATISPNGGGTPTGALAEAINRDFGSFDELKKQLSDAGAKQFGSGWAWLVSDNAGKLSVGSTANQDNPLMPGQSISGTPVLGIDVWEHAYYLRYQNKRADYITSFFDVVDWNAVNDNYAKATQGAKS
jgi:Fe-Mn family superoxide dismutase